MKRRKQRLVSVIISTMLFTGISLGHILSPVTAYGETIQTNTNSNSKSKVERLWGKDRYETSIEVSKYGWTQSDYIVLANGENYADALCAAPLARACNAPILLTEAEKLNDNIKKEIIRLKSKCIYIIGKSGAVSEAIEKELKAMGIETKRLGGVNRYDTSALVGEEIKNISKTPMREVAIVSGESFADAISIAPVAASQNMPILLSEKHNLPQEVKKFIDSSNTIKDIYIIGGESSICDEVFKSVGSNPLRICGSNRYETNVKIMEFFKQYLNFDNIYVVQGDGPCCGEFADALSAAALAARGDSKGNCCPVILVYKSMDSSTEKFIKASIKNNSSITALGGERAVPHDILNIIKSMAASKPVENNENANSQGEKAPRNGNNPQAAVSGGNGAGPSSGSTDNNASSGNNEDEYVVNSLKEISSKLSTINTQVKTANEKKVVSKIQTSINKYLKDQSYNCKSDADEAKKMYGALKDEEKTDIKEKIQSNLDVDMLLRLSSVFNL